MDILTVVFSSVKWDSEAAAMLWKDNMKNGITGPGGIFSAACQVEKALLSATFFRPSCRCGRLGIVLPCCVHPVGCVAWAA